MSPARSLIAALIAAALLTTAGTAGAVLPEGPRVAYTESPVGEPIALLRTTASDGTDIRAIGTPRGAARAELLSGLPIAWSPGGDRLAVHGIHAKSIRIYSVSAAGGGYRLIPKTVGGIFPIYSPDGRTVAFTVSRPEFGSEGTTDEFEGTAIRTVDLLTGRSRQLTPWRDGLRYVGSSFSPDGSTLAATRVDERRGEVPEIVSLDLATGRTGLILRRGVFPVYSPDGSRIAFLREQTRVVRRRGGRRRTADSTDLFTAAADGSQLHRLTRTPELNEYWPSWDPSGQRLAYTVMPEDDSTSEKPSWIAQTNADGTCGRTLLSRNDAHIANAAWRPGPGREAGRIAC